MISRVQQGVAKER